MTAVTNDLTKRWSGQGTATSALRTSNIPGPAYGLGRVPTISLAGEIGTYDERDTESGTRALSNRHIQTRDLSGELVLESFTPAELARYFYGDAAVQDSGTATAQSLGTLVAGQIAHLPHRNVSSLVLTDSAGSPATLAAGTHYTTPTAADLAFGQVSILSVSGLTAPIKAAYSYGATTKIGLLTDAAYKEHELRIQMINTFDQSRLVICLYRVQYDSNGMRELITEKGVGQGKLKFTALADPTKAVDATLGQFGFIELI